MGPVNHGEALARKTFLASHSFLFRPWPSRLAVAEPVAGASGNQNPAKPVTDRELPGRVLFTAGTDGMECRGRHGSTHGTGRRAGLAGDSAGVEVPVSPGVREEYVCGAGESVAM